MALQVSGCSSGRPGEYLVGFVFAALAVGLAYEHDSASIHIAGIAVATVIIYAFGVAWLMVSLGRTLLPSLIAGALPFVPGDAVKASAAYIIAKNLP